MRAALFPPVLISTTNKKYQHHVVGISRPTNKQTENMVWHFPERADFSADYASKIGKTEFYHVTTRVFMLRSVFV